MHPEVTSDMPDRCPKCGMKLVPASWSRRGGHEHDDEHGHHEHEQPRARHMAGHEHGHDEHGHHEHEPRHDEPRARRARRASSGKTTWSRSTA